MIYICSYRDPQFEDVCLEVALTPWSLVASKGLFFLGVVALTVLPFNLDPREGRRYIILTSEATYRLGQGHSHSDRQVVYVERLVAAAGSLFFNPVWPVKMLVHFILEQVFGVDELVCQG